MRFPDPQQGFALPLALTSSALLLLSSLSLQTSPCTRGSAGQALATAQTRDVERSVAMAFQQHAAGAHACLLAMPSSVGWIRSLPWREPCAAPLRRVADRDWQLLDSAGELWNAPVALE